MLTFVVLYLVFFNLLLPPSVFTYYLPLIQAHPVEVVNWQQVGSKQCYNDVFLPFTYCRVPTNEGGYETSDEKPTARETDFSAPIHAGWKIGGTIP